VADAAVVLGAIVGVDPRDSATAASAGRFHTDYTPFLNPGALRGARLGIARESYFGYHPGTDRVTEQAIAVLRAQGAVIVDPADIPTAKQMAESEDEFTVLLYEFKADLNAYLANVGGSPAVRSLADLIDFNEAHAAEEMPYFDQELVIQAVEKGPLTDEAYLRALANIRRLSREEGIDAVMEAHQLDALVTPTGAPGWKIDLIDGDHHLGGSSGPAAMAGYPAVSVPAGHVQGMPVGITFMGRAFSEPKLIALAHAYEQATHARRAPGFATTLP
jgi:amidase